MTFMKIAVGVLAILLISAILYLGIIGYKPAPTQVHTDITTAVTQK